MGQRCEQCGLHLPETGHQQARDRAPEVLLDVNEGGEDIGQYFPDAGGGIRAVAVRQRNMPQQPHSAVFDGGDGHCQSALFKEHCHGGVLH